MLWKYCCLLDLFLHDKGPGLRGKVAHARIDLDALLDEQTLESRNESAEFDHLCNVLAICFLSICATHRMSDPSLQKLISMDSNQVQASADYAPPAAIQRCLAMIQSYQTVFHPHAIINRSVKQNKQSIHELLAMLQVSSLTVVCFALQNLGIHQ